MYIPFWVVIVTIIVVGVVVLYRQKDNTVGKGKTIKSQIENLWEWAEEKEHNVLQESAIYGKIEDHAEMIQAMKKDIVRLRERYKNDLPKQKEIAQDWLDYIRAVGRIKLAMEMSYVTEEDNEIKRCDEEMEQNGNIVQEIGKRVAQELGEESFSKHVHDKLWRNAEIFRKIAEKSK